MHDNKTVYTESGVIRYSLGELQKQPNSQLVTRNSKLVISARFIT
jgi:hypothetical protein